MARPPLALNSHGAISATRVTDEGVTPEKWRAHCRYRGANGRTRQIEKTGSTKDKAKAALRKHLRELMNDGGTITLAVNSRFSDAAKIWIDSVERKRVGSTYDTYRRWLSSPVLPALGQLRIRECTTQKLQDFFDALEVTKTERGEPYAANSRRSIRKVVRGVMSVCVRRGILAHNPADALDRIEGGGKKRRAAYDREQLAKFYAALDKDKAAKRSGLNNLVKFLFLSGFRVSEALGLRWQEVNLGDKPVKVVDPVAGEMLLPPRSIWMNGNIVRVTGKGLVRHTGKTEASQGLLSPMPETLYLMLLMLRDIDADPLAPVFPSGTGGWRCPNNTQTAIRRLRARIGFEEFTSHFGRRTFGTTLDEAKQTPRQIADALRKASVVDTMQTYMARGRANPEVAAAIDALHTPEEKSAS